MWKSSLNQYEKVAMSRIAVNVHPWYGQGRSTEVVTIVVIVIVVIVVVVVVEMVGIVLSSNHRSRSSK